MELQKFNLGSYLKFLRTNLIIGGKSPSLRAVSEQIGINHSYLARIEKGEKTNVSGVLIRKFVDFYKKFYSDISFEKLTSLCHTSDNKGELVIVEDESKSTKSGICCSDYFNNIQFKQNYAKKYNIPDNNIKVTIPQYKNDIVQDIIQDIINDTSFSIDSTLKAVIDSNMNNKEKKYCVDILNYLYVRLEKN